MTLGPRKNANVIHKTSFANIAVFNRFIRDRIHIDLPHVSGTEKIDGSRVRIGYDNEGIYWKSSRREDKFRKRGEYKDASSQSENPEFIKYSIALDDAMCYAVINNITLFDIFKKQFIYNESREVEYSFEILIPTLMNEAVPSGSYMVDVAYEDIDRVTLFAHSDKLPFFDSWITRLDFGTVSFRSAKYMNVQFPHITEDLVDSFIDMDKDIANGHTEKHERDEYRGLLEKFYSNPIFLENRKPVYREFEGVITHINGVTFKIPNPKIVRRKNDGR